jgi:hypothetical protein
MVEEHGLSNGLLRLLRTMFVIDRTTALVYFSGWKTKKLDVKL